MAPIFIKPENALKKAEDLLKVGQKDAGISALTDVIVSKRSRGVPVSVLEPIMLKLIQICVADRRGQLLKEVLQDYRNTCQNTNVGTIGTVVTDLIQRSEAQVREAQAKADKINLEKLEDLEVIENPESILMSAVSDEQDKDRTDRGIVTPWLKFLWETYRNILDTLRNNTRLETIYQSVATQALQFCLKFQRKNEFRRLCEKLRTHLSAIIKNTNQSHGINLQDPESLQRHLELRFGQLHVATEMELWQEAFRSVEDIHLLLASTKKDPKPSMLVSYYEKLTRIMTVSGNHLYHAAAWHKYYDTVRHHAKAIGASEFERIASHVVLSTMAIPIINPTLRVATMSIDENKVRDTRLGNLLGLTSSPKRATLISDLIGSGVLSKVSPELRDFFYLMEEKFHPLSICRSVSPYLIKFHGQPEFAKYAKSLQVCLVTRLFQQLSQVYTVIKLDYVLQLTTFPEPLTFTSAQLEQFLMNGSRRGEFSLRLDYRSRSIHFTSDAFSDAGQTTASGPQLQPTPADQIRSQLSGLAEGLSAITRVVVPRAAEEQVAARMEAVAVALAKMKEEHEGALKRKAVLERRKEIIETLNARKEKEEAREKALLLQREQEAEKIRLAEDARRREMARLERERDAIAKEEARRLAETLQASGGLKLQGEKLANLDKDRLVELQVEQIEKNKRDMEANLKAMAKSLDYTHRAYRLEEIPLLEKDYERQKKADLAFYEAAKQAQFASSKAAYEHGMSLKAKMERMLPSYMDFKAKLESRRSEELRQLKQKLDQKIEAEKKFRMEEYHRLKEQERQRRETEEAERLRKEEEDRRRREEEERLEAERQAEEKARREAEEERRRQLDVIFAKQQAREQEVAAQQEARRLERLNEEQNSGRYIPLHRRAGGLAAPPATTTTTATASAASPAGTAGRPEAFTELRRSTNAWRPRGAAGSPAASDASPVPAAAAPISRPRPTPASTPAPAPTPSAGAAGSSAGSSPAPAPGKYISPAMRQRMNQQN
ncbi:hypothetical protein BJ085DRAFT_36559 [Dimargaris cristalligena]|uniref:Eukaryotic translation initiation factor 3 subunit A n=1 Tax=Dimargaris cristalligena TaxID=215637 RepID=A0A4P9ZPG3_9FUNG|nr:hypothetical protein BJ085DRAFT_36559 [Dimargaris cristalligena]|eukprot:RKP35324.1 hypothetical protein BJ085DRAFT_36559 [Dimargaris cristalligena]